MRSRSDRVDVGKVCMTLGGGGHPGAGGCHINSDVVVVKDRVVRALDAAFNRSRPVSRHPTQDEPAARTQDERTGDRPVITPPERDPSQE
jgi:hypothetical protein